MCHDGEGQPYRLNNEMTNLPLEQVALQLYDLIKHAPPPSFKPGRQSRHLPRHSMTAASSAPSASSASVPSSSSSSSSGTPVDLNIASFHSWCIRCRLYHLVRLLRIFMSDDEDEAMIPLIRAWTISLDVMAEFVCDTMLINELKTHFQRIAIDPKVAIVGP